MSGVRKYKGMVLLMSLFLLGPLLTYRCALSRTIDMWVGVSRLEAEVASLRVEAHARESAGADTVVGNGDIIGNGELIAKIAEVKVDRKLSVEKYSPYISADSDGLLIQSAEVCIDGSFKDILRVVYMIERQDFLCRVASVDFRCVRLPKDKELKLQATVIIQQITQN